MKTRSELRITRIIFVASFLISTAALAMLALSQPTRTHIAASYLFGAILVLGTMAIGSLTGRHRRIFGFILLVSILNLVFVPAEAYLRFKGFRYESGIQFGYPRPYQFNVFEPDEKLFWKFPPSAPGVNSYGFRGPEVERPKPRGTYRILYIGNSCTFQGFPRMVELALREENPGVECLNFANPGYTSHQGRVFVESYIDELEPDLVVASYGWNDRWLAYGAVDREKKIRISGGALTGAVRGINARWRFLQFMRRALSPVLGKTAPLESSRVPPGHFSENLRAIGDACSARSIPVIFATEPSSHPMLGVPDYVVLSRYASSKEASLALLREYNDIVRKVAGEKDGRHLIDLDTRISGRGDVRSIFTGDGLHFSEAGLALVTGIESRFIAERFLETAHHGQRHR